MEQQFYMPNESMQTKKKSKFPIVMLCILVVLALVAGGVFLWLKSQGSIFETFAEQMETAQENSVLEASGFLEAVEEHKDSANVSLELSVVDIPSSLGGDYASVITGTDVEVVTNYDLDEKKADVAITANIANMLSLGAKLYADENVIQANVPMLSTDTFELKNENITGQLSSFIPALSDFEGARISFEKTDYEQLFDEFKTVYKDRLEEANENIKIEKDDKVKRDVFGKSDVSCGTLDVEIPPETIKEYVECAIEFITENEALKNNFVLREIVKALNEKEISPETIYATLYTAKKTIFAKSVIVGAVITINEESVELAFEGEDDIFDSVIFTTDDNIEILYEKAKKGSIITETLTTKADGEKTAECEYSYDSASGELKALVQLDGATLEFGANTSVRKGDFTADDMKISVIAAGEALTLEGDLVIKGYEPVAKISETPKAFTAETLTTILASLVGSLM